MKLRPHREFVLLQPSADFDVFVGEAGEDGTAFGADGGGYDQEPTYDYDSGPYTDSGSDNGPYCREFQTTVVIDGQPQVQLLAAESGLPGVTRALAKRRAFAA